MKNTFGTLIYFTSVDQADLIHTARLGGAYSSNNTSSVCSVWLHLFFSHHFLAIEISEVTALFNPPIPLTDSHSPQVSSQTFWDHF